MTMSPLPIAIILLHEEPGHCEEVAFWPQNTTKIIVENRRINVVRNILAKSSLPLTLKKKCHLDEIFTINVLYLCILAVSEESIWVNICSVLVT